MIVGLFAGKCDSIETLRRTHSSYFELSEAHIDQFVARGLAELGLR
jgi:hypothetical protein